MLEYTYLKLEANGRTQRDRAALDVKSNKNDKLRILLERRRDTRETR
jgi:hypothetical protein